jgi:hypothetical protein
MMDNYTVEQVQEGMQVAAGVRGVVGVSLAVLLISGIYMARSVWGRVMWVDVALGAIVLMAVLGAALTGPRMVAIRRVVAEEQGPVSPNLRRELRHPLLWASI